MKTWKIITIAALAVVAAALLTSTAYAMGPWGWGGNQYGGYGGMMGGGGMMGRGYGYGYGPYNPAYPTQPGITTPTTPTTPYQPYQAVYPFQFGGGCHGRFGGNNYGYTAPPYAYTGAPLNITPAVTTSKN